MHKEETRVTVHSTGKEIHAMSRNSLHKISLVATSRSDAFSFRGNDGS